MTDVVVVVTFIVVPALYRQVVTLAGAGRVTRDHHPGLGKPDIPHERSDRLVPTVEAVAAVTPGGFVGSHNANSFRTRSCPARR
ncbi:MAG TPA: hypothetical protein VF326_15175 [Anaerolineaceae bacterium]